MRDRVSIALSAGGRFVATAESRLVPAGSLSIPLRTQMAAGKGQSYIAGPV